jgi:hypothetical protein
VATEPCDVSIGRPDEWARFAAAHPGFIAEYPCLISLANNVFNRRLPSADTADVILFGLALMCLDDFEDIVTLVGNGRGFGAQKLLRGMYERIVTLAYLHANPEEIKAFVAFEKIRAFRLAQEIHSATEDDHSAAALAECSEARDAVRAEFQRRCTCHRSCEATVEAYSWTQLSFPALAAKAGHHLDEDILASYSVPLTETHPTAVSIAARMSLSEGHTSFRDAGEKSRAVGDLVLNLAHKYALLAMELQVTHFQELSHLEESIAQRAEAWRRIFAA